MVLLLAQFGRGGADYVWNGEMWAWYDSQAPEKGSVGGYVWDGEEWVWQDLLAPAVDTEEGSGGGGVVATGGRYREDDFEEEHLYRENDGGGWGYNTHHRLQEESIKVDSDEEIDPHEIDIGFHEEPTEVEQATPSSLEPGLATTKQPQGGNFFAQAGILVAVVVGTVVGLLCTILLVMFIVYRMQKADAFAQNQI